MIKPSLFLFITLFATPLFAVTLIEEGAPKAIVILPDQPRPVETLAAEELQHHLFKASGAELRIVSESAAAHHTGPKIYLGKTKALAQAGFGVEAPEHFEWDRTKYPWYGRLVGDDFFFYGVDGDGELFGQERSANDHDRQPAGTLFAVYDFLEQQCGVRWIWPGASGEIIPKHSTLTIEQYEKSGMPRFINSNWRAWSVHHRNPSVGFTGKESLDRYLHEQRQWLNRQRFRYLSPFNGFEGYFKYTKAHLKVPGLVAMTPDGKREVFYHYPSPREQKIIGWSRVAMCVSHPEQPMHYVQAWRQRFLRTADQFNTKIVGINEADIPGYCICPDCRAWDQKDPRFDTHPYWNGTAPTPTSAAGMWTLMKASDPTTPPLTDRYARFWLACLDEVRKTDPDAKIWANAYTNYAAPPFDVKLNQDVLVRLVGWPYLGWAQEATARAIKEWDGWRASGAALLLRPNTTLTGHCLPVFYAREFAAAFSHAAANGLMATDLDSLTGQWGTQGPTLYTIARMHIEPERPVEEILAEFYRAFGPAEREVAAYFEHWAAITSQLTDAKRLEYRTAMQHDNATYGIPRVHRLILAAKQFPPEVMAKGRELLELAKVAAQADSDAKKRVQVLDLGLKNAELALEALALYQSYAKEPSMQNRLALDKAVATIHNFRAESETATLQNLNHIASEERSLWHPISLQKLKSKAADTSIDAD